MYTHFFTPHVEANGITGGIFPLDDFEKVLRQNPKVKALGGMALLNLKETEVHLVKATSDRFWIKLGSRGWSWLHVQNNHICAGAGGLNSKQIRKIKET